MAPKLYYCVGSPYCRTIFITAKAIGLKLDTKEVDLEKDEHLKPEDLKLNPLHTVPTLDDNGAVIWDSHAISTYLVEKYGKDDSLYPRDFQKHVLIDQRLHFGSGTLSPPLFAIENALIKKEIKEPTPQMIEAAKEAYGLLDKFLKGKLWVALDNVTLADIGIYTILTSVNCVVKIDPKEYPNIINWINRVEALPCLEGDDKELKLFDDWIKSMV